MKITLTTSFLVLCATAANAYKYGGGGSMMMGGGGGGMMGGGGGKMMGMMSSGDKKKPGDDKKKDEDEGELITIMAKVTGEYVNGTVYFAQDSTEYTDGYWAVVLDGVDKSGFGDCPTGLNWHIHEFTLNEERTTCGDLGGHWDPTYGCAGASQHQKSGVCGMLYPDLGGVKSCDPMADITTCEMGDLSGKMGQLSFKTGVKQTFEDVYITNIDVFSDLSIVFHCGSPRVACGNLEPYYK